MIYHLLDHPLCCGGIAAAGEGADALVEAEENLPGIFVQDDPPDAPGEAPEDLLQLGHQERWRIVKVQVILRCNCL